MYNEQLKSVRLLCVSVACLCHPSFSALTKFAILSGAFVSVVRPAAKLALCVLRFKRKCRHVETNKKSIIAVNTPIAMHARNETVQISRLIQGLGCNVFVVCYTEKHFFQGS